MLTSHPNAEVSIYTGAATAILVYVAGLFGVDPPAEIGVACSTLLTGIVLYLGKRSRKPAV
jgi:hydrogenase/urease accessory protein HupE